MSLVPAAPTNLDVNDDDILRGSQKSTKTYNKMFCIARELCFLLLIVFTTYASFNSSANSGGGPPAGPFFPRGSLVGDFYRGELVEALVRASEADISFIMYYAPWDADSQVARRHFMAVANQLYKQVYFAGVNCWQPRGDCRKTLSKVQQFPRLVAYVTHETGVEYRGPRTAQYMTAFLDGVLRPLHRLTTLADLTRLRSTHNAVVVAYLNFYGMRGGPPYRAMYETALKFLEKDVRQEVAFAVVTSFKTTIDMGGNRTPSIKLYLWNETLEYPGVPSAAALSEWVTSRLHQVSLWLTPPGVKSLTLAPYINHGPALLLFTPWDNFVMYDLLREVGLEYYNCQNSSAVSQLSQNVSTYVSERISRSRRAMLSCQSRRHDMAPTVQIVNNVWTNFSCGKRRASSSHAQCLSPAAQCAEPTLLQQPTLTSMLSTEEDPLAAHSLTSWAWTELCRRLLPPPPRLPPSHLAPSLQGLACRHNRSVSLLAMDSELFSHFARGLGVDPDLARDKTRVVLLNSQMEMTHVLNDSVTRASLSQFLVNFTEGRLERFQRTSPPPLTPSTITSDDKTTTVSITELTSETFLPVAFNETMNVVVLFYTRYCAFCQAVSHAYLSTARLLRRVPSLLFTRLNGESNDLPWQFTAPHYPSVLFFPARRKAESRVFSSRVGVTIESLTQFVLANLPLELRLIAMVQVCQHYTDTQTLAFQPSTHRRACLLKVRREVLESISSHLARYRTISVHMQPSKAKRAVLGRLLARLQYLKQLQFSLSVDSAQLTKHFLHHLSEEITADDKTRLRDEL